MGIVTKEWVATSSSQQKRKANDKNYMKLNMLATKHKATTCKEQYNLRKKIDVRIPEPTS